MSILDDIIAYKRQEVAQAKREAPFAALSVLAGDMGPPRDFARAMRASAQNGAALIAEIKKASPSKGLIRENFNPPALARAYEAGGATCLSVLTDAPSFQGSPDYLRAAREASALPILRKDFLVDPYQVAEARAWGADCILIILACTDDALACDLEAAAREFGMSALIETHDEREAERALKLGSPLIGVNNRNLRTFETSLETSERLAPMILAGGRLPIAESGIASAADIARLGAAGVNAFLVGESLMRRPDVEAATRDLLAPPRTA